MQQNPFSFPEDDERVAYAMLVQNYPAVLKAKEKNEILMELPFSVDGGSEPLPCQDSAVEKDQPNGS